MTPAQLWYYGNAWKQKERREDYRTGVITYVVRAIMGDKNAKPMDFFEVENQTSKQQKLRDRLRAMGKKKSNSVEQDRSK